MANLPLVLDDASRQIKALPPASGSSPPPVGSILFIHESRPVLYTAPDASVWVRSGYGVPTTELVAAGGTVGDLPTQVINASLSSSAVTGAVAEISRPAVTSQAIVAGSASGRLSRSTDGATWSTQIIGSNTWYVTADGDTLYAIDSAGARRNSTDHGVTWNIISGTFPQTIGIRATIHFMGRWWVVVNRAATSYATELYSSGDGGVTWTNHGIVASQADSDAGSVFQCTPGDGAFYVSAPGQAFSSRIVVIYPQFGGVMRSALILSSGVFGNSNTANMVAGYPAQIHDGLAYVGANNNYLLSADLLSFSSNNGGPWSPGGRNAPLVLDNTLFTYSQNSTVLAIHRDRFSAARSVTNSVTLARITPPVLFGGNAYFRPIAGSINIVKATLTRAVGLRRPRRYGDLIEYIRIK